MDDPEIKVALYQLLAFRLRAEAAKMEFAANCVRATAAMNSFAAAIQTGYDLEVAEHPDLAELNVQLDSWYR